LERLAYVPQLESPVMKPIGINTPTGHRAGLMLGDRILDVGISWTRIMQQGPSFVKDCLENHEAPAIEGIKTAPVEPREVHGGTVPLSWLPCEAEMETTAPDLIVAVAAVIERRCNKPGPEEILGYTLVQGFAPPGKPWIAAQMGPIETTPRDTDGAFVKVFVDDEPMATIDAKHDWTATEGLYRPGDLILGPSVRIPLQAPCELRTSLASPSHVWMRLTAKLTKSS
jgi:hypothetical protein